jgi:hypothetical protein
MRGYCRRFVRSAGTGGSGGRRFGAQSPNLMQCGLELLEKFKGLFAVEGGRARREHGDRPPPVLDKLGDRKFGHGRTIIERMFADNEGI